VRLESGAEVGTAIAAFFDHTARIEISDWASPPAP